MSTTVKRITISLTKEQERQLRALCFHFGENQSQAVHRAITTLYVTKIPADPVFVNSDHGGKAK